MSGHVCQKRTAEPDEARQGSWGRVDPPVVLGRKSPQRRRRRVGMSGEETAIAVHVGVHVFGHVDNIPVFVLENKIAVSPGALQHQRASPTDACSDGTFKKYFQHAVMSLVFGPNKVSAADVSTQRQHEGARGFRRTFQVRHAESGHPAESRNVRIPA